MHTGLRIVSYAYHTGTCRCFSSTCAHQAGLIPSRTQRDDVSMWRVQSVPLPAHTPRACAIATVSPLKFSLRRNVLRAKWRVNDRHYLSPGLSQPLIDDSNDWGILWKTWQSKETAQTRRLLAEFLFTKMAWLSFSHVLVSKLNAQFSLLIEQEANNQLVLIHINYHWRKYDGGMPLLVQNGLCAIFNPNFADRLKKSKNSHDWLLNPR